MYIHAYQTHQPSLTCISHIVIIIIRMPRFALFHVRPPSWRATCPSTWQVPESPAEGDSVTKLHEDMTDAVNVMTHCQTATDEVVVVRGGDTPLDENGRWGQPSRRAAFVFRRREFHHRGTPFAPVRQLDPLCLTSLSMISA